MKKTLVIIISVVCVFIWAVLPCYAVSLTNIVPRWNNVGGVNTSLVFYENVGEAVAYVTKGESVTTLEGTITIYKFQNNEWIYEDSISKSTTRATLNMAMEFEGTSGLEYRMDFVVIAYSGTTVIEEITDVEYATCP
ncbi:MAG: hypothetical protein IJ489_02120 [Clostridia bacterium]|nr:hypothetical protein [Clostridia bacterium]